MSKEWDVFISHASEDKIDFVRELAEKLSDLNVKVWYDEFTLKLGDSLIGSIDYGLTKSNFGVIVISKNFLEKKWTDYEYKSLITKEEKGKKSILPIWHNISADEVKKYSLYLSDKLAINTATNSVNKIALEICKIVRPEIIQGIKGYLLYKEILKNGEIKTIERSKLKPQQKPQSKLSKNLICRAKNIYLGIGKYTNISLEKSIFNYELDLRPEREIQVWEMMNASYLEFIEKNNITNEVIKKDVYNLLLNFSVGQIPKTTYLTDEQVNELMELWKNNIYEY
jgi:hypothetical protein